MRCMPTASAIVIATGKPSGTIDTIWLIATINTSASGNPRHRPSSTTSTNRPSAAATRARPKCSRRCSSGVFGCSAPSVSPAMRPTSVCTPVATTTARARPAVTWVPEYTMSWRSARPVDCCSAATDLATGTDSPVSAASASCNCAASTRRASAATASPAANSTMSPGTSALASISCSLPSRSTRTRSAASRRSAAIERSARPSWNVPINALTKTTARITAASPWWPSATASAAATNRMVISGLLNCRAKLRHSGRKGGSGRALAPCSDRRCRTMASSRPVAGSTPQRASASSTRNACQTAAGSSGSSGSGLARCRVCCGNGIESLCGTGARPSPRGGGLLDRGQSWRARRDGRGPRPRDHALSRIKPRRGGRSNISQASSPLPE